MFDVIPAIDLIDGKCVRLTRGDFQTSVSYSNDPVETAKSFEDAGITWLHIVDLDGARTGTPKHLDVLESIKNNTGLTVDFGGGLRDAQAILDAFNCGADKVTVGSAAIQQPLVFDKWLDDFGADRIILAADLKDGYVAISGWTETSDQALEDVIRRFTAMGLSHIMVTDVSRDGTLAGPALPLYEWVKREFPNLFLIASGGVGSVKDIESLRHIGCDAVIVGKALYEGRIRVDELVGSIHPQS